MDFAEFMAKERTRLNGEKDKINAEIEKLKESMVDVDKELKAIDAYERAKTGTTSGKGKRRAGIRDSVLKLVKEAGGMTRAQVLEALGATGDKSATQSASNALANLKKQGKLTSKDGTYRAV